MDTSGGTGGAAPIEAAALSSKKYDDNEVNTFVAKAKREAQTKAAAEVSKALLDKLGVSSIEDALDRLSKVEAPKPKKSEAETIAEKITADYQVKLETERKARIAAEEALKAASAAREAEALRSFLLAHVAGTTDPALAMAVFGVQYKAPREIRLVDGKPTVFEDDTPLPHIDAATYVKETLAKPELGFLRKPTSVGTGARTGNGSAATATPAVQAQRKRLTAQEQIEVAVAAGLASVSGANGSGR